MILFVVVVVVDIILWTKSLKLFFFIRGGGGGMLPFRGVGRGAGDEISGSPTSQIRKTQGYFSISCNNERYKRYTVQSELLHIKNAFEMN